MAKRLYFLVSNDADVYFDEYEVDFTYHTGHSIVQKQKSISSLHNAIHKKHPSAKILEVSSKSDLAIGKKLSAFNLSFFDKKTNRKYSVENIFQASKVFELGGPFTDLLYVSPVKAKRDERLKNSGKLIKFRFNNTDWELFPRSLFYDWLYIYALHGNHEIREQVTEFNCFTDIEFNHKTSFNCQARSVAIYVSLKNKGMLESALLDIKLYKEVYNSSIEKNEQLSLL